MKPPPYSLQSFRELAEGENRRGRDISRIDPAVGAATRDLRQRRERLLADLTRAKGNQELRQALRSAYRKERNDLRDARDRAVEAVLLRALDNFEASLDRGEFSLGLRRGETIRHKPTYVIDSGLDVSFPAKQAARVIKEAADSPAPSRNGVVRALRSSLEKNYSHAVYKVDIANFFESVPHERLLELTSDLSRIDSVSDRLVRQLLAEYQAIEGTDVGLPRGVGMSSHLAELYLTKFDAVVRSQPGVLFHARYVDDVIMVLDNHDSLVRLRSVIERELESLRLTANTEKSREVISDPNGDYPAETCIEYLGYAFQRADGTLSIGLTPSRASRRSHRLQVAIDAWLAAGPSRHWPNHGHNGLLLDRVRYLAGNTKLANSKSNVAVGLYFSNSGLDSDATEIRELDDVLKQFLHEHRDKMPDKLRDRLAAISFVDMFRERTFLHFRQARMRRIMRIWSRQ